MQRCRERWGSRRSGTTEPIAATESEPPLEAARRLAPRAARAGRLRASAGAGSRLSSSLRSRDAGLFRLCVPAALGGASRQSPAVLIECVEALARGDGSAGWCVAIAATSGLLAGYLPEDAAREIYAPPRSIVGGVFAPRGDAVPSAAGFQRQRALAVRQRLRALRLADGRLRGRGTNTGSGRCPAGCRT